MDDPNPTLEELQVRGDAAMIDTRRVIEEMRYMAESTRRFIEKRQWPHYADEVAPNANFLA